TPAHRRDRDLLRRPIRAPELGEVAFGKILGDPGELGLCTRLVGTGEAFGELLVVQPPLSEVLLEQLGDPVTFGIGYPHGRSLVGHCAHLARERGGDIRALDPSSPGPAPDHHQFGWTNPMSAILSRLSSRAVRIIGPSAVMATECSKCAALPPSRVTTVQSSSRVITSCPCRVVIGSIARHMPSASLTPLPLRP